MHLSFQLTERILVPEPEAVVVEMWGRPSEMLGKDGEEYNWRSPDWVNMLKGEPDSAPWPSWKRLKK